MTQRLARRFAAIVIGAGLIWSVAFVVLAVTNQLAFYGDGAMFSYAVAVRDVWAFHWHNIAGRSSIYLLTLLPAEWLARDDPAAGILVYEVLFYIGPLVGLVLTYALDRTPRRSFFVAACASTALLAPLIFGFPTEMWLAHAIFWPVLTLSHSERRGSGITAAIVAAWLLLAFTHEGAIVLLAGILVTLLPRGLRSIAFRRGALALAICVVAAALTKLIAPPDAYYADAFWRAAFHFFDPAIVKVRIVQLLLATTAVFLALTALLWKPLRRRASIVAFVISLALLLAYWHWFDDTVHASDRYYLRTCLVVAIPLFGLFAALDAQTWIAQRRGLIGIGLSLFVLVTAIHLVETWKFLSGWQHYRSAVAALARSAEADPALGDPSFISSARLPPELAPWSWFSTTPYLSILLSDFKPQRLVIDPTGNYFWLSCAAATSNRDAPSRVPVAARELVRIYSCQHRPD